MLAAAEVLPFVAHIIVRVYFHIQNYLVALAMPFDVNPVRITLNKAYVVDKYRIKHVFKTADLRFVERNSAKSLDKPRHKIGEHMMVFRLRIFPIFAKRGRATLDPIFVSGIPVNVDDLVGVVRKTANIERVIESAKAQHTAGMSI